VTDGNGSRRSLGVIVTGAASGIGRAVACSLAEDGFAVTATDINRAGLDDLEAEALVKKWVLKGAVMDVRDPPSVSAACHDVSAGAVGMAAFVHCAGITWRGSMLEMAGADYERIVGTNLGGSFICLTAAARALVSQGTGGSIVAITSV
jgi:NAD(P)-dependent dehydrogenase (short-subunit alcohol dehydrogenase family)